jgi:hypothetical protein
MKAKNNLELFRNEIEFTMEHSEESAPVALYRTMFDIYYRETGAEKTTSIFKMLDWYSDVPRETLELDWYSYHLINEYYSVLLEEAIIDVDSKPIEWYIMFKTLIRLNIIPSRYSQMLLKDFMKIIRLKEDKK